ncbi:MAG: Rrf2 family transcriptional regulator [Clostridiaceae bacterium]|nr:Rrf2 family transcriptional regulator [Clostridiaceae bacterium]
MISTKGRYALRVMLDLAQQQTDDYIPLSEIAERQEISIKYLEIILKALVRENILQGQRGKGGGYRLTRAPKDYTVEEILELTEGSLATVACLMPNAKPCERKDHCLTLPMWAKFDGMIHDFFSHITLEDLLEGNIR